MFRLKSVNIACELLDSEREFNVWIDELSSDVNRYHFYKLFSSICQLK